MRYEYYLVHVPFEGITFSQRVLKTCNLSSSVYFRTTQVGAEGKADDVIYLPIPTYQVPDWQICKPQTTV